MTRTIFYVCAPNDETLTVVAESEAEAIEEALAFCDDLDSEMRNYTAHPSTEPPTFWRWVGFGSLFDAEEQLDDLDKHGVTADRLRIRESRPFGLPVDLWEVGARDEDWYRLPSCVLCGGAE